MSGLYIHVPFCHAKCAYCDFYSVDTNRISTEFHRSLKNEFNQRRSELNGPITTIYLGGGTPSSLGINGLQHILEWIPTNEMKEFTIEVNPEDIDKDMARFIAETPINRVSMGIQSLNDEELRFIGRRHSAAQAVKAYSTLRNAGIDNISLDLIFGLPWQTFESWSETIDGLLNLEPDHLSAYSLMIEKGTRLWAMRQSGRFMEVDDSTVEKMYFSLCEKSARAGFSHYEISNFARGGRESLHNSSYWNLTPYLGLGPGAHSYDGQVRRYNPWKLQEYVANQGLITIIDEENTDEKINDYIMIRLRTADGLSIPHLIDLFGEAVKGKMMKQAEPDINSGNLSCDGTRLSIPEHKWLVSDPIISNLMI